MKKFACVCLLLSLICPLVVFADANTTQNIGWLQFDLSDTFVYIGTQENENSVYKTYETQDGYTTILSAMITGHSCHSAEEAFVLCEFYVEGMLESDIEIKVTESQSLPGSYYSAHVGKRILSGDPVWFGVFVYVTSSDLYMITYAKLWDESADAGDEFYDIYKSATYDGVPIYGENVLSTTEAIEEPASSPKTDAAAIDLSNMSLDELIALREQVTMAMWETEEWQEVEVPIGVYQVGVDIPAGNWTVKCHKSFDNAYISWGESLDENGHSIAWQGRNDILNYVYNPDYKYYEEGDGPLEYSFEVRDGEYIIIGVGNVVFTPFVGKPDLGFK